ncbi:MAG: alanine racemase [Planctomycetota bacterium]
MQGTSHLEIDLTAIDHNLAVLRRALISSGRSAKICAALKADAYGLGAVRIAKRLSIRAIDMIAVYTLDQARDLVDAAIQQPILVLMPAQGFDRSDSLYRAAQQGRIHFTIHDLHSLELVAALGERLGMALPVHVELDTGMARGGSNPETATQLVQQIADTRRLWLAGLSTQFASAGTDELMTFEQASMLADWAADLGDLVPSDCVMHLSNTSGVFRSAALHSGMVRVGAGLLGYASEHFGDPQAAELIDLAGELKPAVRWLSRIVHVQEVEAGRTVGYAAAWRATRRTRLGLVPVGYAEGYPYTLSSDLRHGAAGEMTKVGVSTANGTEYVDVIGRVSMDQIVIDLTDLDQEITIGSTVELYGNEKNAPNHVPTLAKAAGVNTYELLCRVNPKVPRVYLAVEEAKAVQRSDVAALAR